MNKYQKELQTLRPNDEIQHVKILDSGYQFIFTASHGYLVVPVDDKNYQMARNIVNYGYSGVEAIYLEEDCEAGEFLNLI